MNMVYIMTGYFSYPSLFLLFHGEQEFAKLCLYYALHKSTGNERCELAVLVEIDYKEDVHVLHTYLLSHPFSSHVVLRPFLEIIRGCMI